jgi:uncharacterized protein (DUF433 family)
VAAEAIEKALLAGESIRVRAIMRAASLGFRVQNLADAFRWLREDSE